MNNTTRFLCHENIHTRREKLVHICIIFERFLLPLSLRLLLFLKTVLTDLLTGLYSQVFIDHIIVTVLPFVDLLKSAVNITFNSETITKLAHGVEDQILSHFRFLDI